MGEDYGQLPHNLRRESDFVLGQLTRTVLELEKRVDLLSKTNEEMVERVEAITNPEWVAKAMEEWAHKAVGKTIIANTFRLLMLTTVATAIIWREQFFDWWARL